MGMPAACACSGSLTVAPTSRPTEVATSGEQHDDQQHAERGAPAHVEHERPDGDDQRRLDQREQQDRGPEPRQDRAGAVGGRQQPPGDAQLALDGEQRPCHQGVHEREQHEVGRCGVVEAAEAHLLAGVDRLGAHPRLGQLAGEAVRGLGRRRGVCAADLGSGGGRRDPHAAPRRPRPAPMPARPRPSSTSGRRSARPWRPARCRARPRSRRGSRCPPPPSPCAPRAAGRRASRTARRRCRRGRRAGRPGRAMPPCRRGRARRARSSPCSRTSTR